MQQVFAFQVQESKASPRMMGLMPQTQRSAEATLLKPQVIGRHAQSRVSLQQNARAPTLAALHLAGKNGSPEVSADLPQKQPPSSRPSPASDFLALHAVDGPLELPVSLESSEPQARSGTAKARIADRMARTFPAANRRHWSRQCPRPARLRWIVSEKP